MGDRLRVRPPRREVVVRPPPDPAEATESDDREGGRLLGVRIMLLGMFTGRIESVGVDDFWGVAVVVAVARLSSSFFSSKEAAGGALGASLPSATGPSLVAAAASAGGTSVAMVWNVVLCSWPVVG